MLNRSELLHQLEQISSSLFVDHSSEYDIAHHVWERIAADPLFIHKTKSAAPSLALPAWEGNLAQAIPVPTNNCAYHLFSVDGSQIYPDKHQGTNCFLINIGMVELLYGSTERRPFIHATHPYLFLEDTDEELFPFTTDLVNCRRQEYELRAALEAAKVVAAKPLSVPSLLLFDGSLIFWHLDSYDLSLKQTFLSCYLALLQQLYDQRVLVASYISLPKGKELVNLVRFALQEGMIPGYDENTTIDHVVDSTITHSFLTMHTRSIVFKNNASISKLYPDFLHPHFFYLHVGDEIGRVEIPAWVAQDEDMVNQVARIILDQSIKGRGYPVALAEAHEQAVIKGPDRDFFYHLIYKLGFERKKRFNLSQKSIKKRGIGI
ncbi:MAG: DNA double-strand break repair nuclease NurA [Candidatus Dependentiae bacterium]|nr:DNA double-strand break repair nuclease NurA [Candidatus Dependentiae bacterium]